MNSKQRIRAHRVPLALAACLTGLGLAACSSTGQDTAGSSSSEPPSSPETSTSTDAAPSTDSDPSASSAPSGSDSASGSSTASAASSSGAGASSSSDQVTRCTADDLDVSVEPGDAAAGSITYTIGFRNTSDDPCRLDGHPGVSAVGGGDGSQIGASAARDKKATVAAVLIPNAHATAQLTAVNIGDSGGPLGQDCQAQAADGWRIYPPDSRESVYVKQSGLHACAAEDADWLTVSVVQPVH